MIRFIALLLQCVENKNTGNKKQNESLTNRDFLPNNICKNLFTVSTLPLIKELSIKRGIHNQFLRPGEQVKFISDLLPVANRMKALINKTLI